MSAERFEITLSDDGQIHISGSNGRRASLITPDGIIGYVTHGAIRQQSRDIASRDAVIVACAKAVGASVSPECSDEFRAMLPGEIRALVDQLRTDLAAAVTRAEQAEARLAAIDGAPTLCWQDVHDLSDLYWRRPDPAQVDTRELIARPAKD